MRNGRLSMRRLSRTYVAGKQYPSRFLYLQTDFLFRSFGVLRASCQLGICVHRSAECVFLRRGTRSAKASTTRGDVKRSGGATLTMSELSCAEQLARFFPSAQPGHSALQGTTLRSRSGRLPEP